MTYVRSTFRHPALPKNVAWVHGHSIAECGMRNAEFKTDYRRCVRGAGMIRSTGTRRGVLGDEHRAAQGGKALGHRPIRIIS